MMSSHANNHVEKPLLCDYKDGRLLLIYDFDGSVGDKSSNKIVIAKCGTLVEHYSRVPQILKTAGLMLGSGKSNNFATDPDEMLLNQEINDISRSTSEDSEGFELRSTVKLPFKCKRCFFLSNRDPCDSFLINENNKGYTWAFFWLVKDE